jgi:hypothetical protein
VYPADVTEEATEGFVMVPVPADRVLEVYRLLAGQPATVSPERSREHADDDVTEWTPDRLGKALALVSYRAQQLILRLSESPGESLGLDEVADRARIGTGAAGEAQLQGLLGNIRRNCNWVGRSLPLPFDVAQTDDGVRLRMSKEMAAFVTMTTWRRRAKPS